MHYDLFRKELMRLAKPGVWALHENVRRVQLRDESTSVARRKEARWWWGDDGSCIYVVQSASMAANAWPISVTAKEEPKERPDFFNEVEETLRWTMNFPNGATCDAVTSFNGSGNNFRAEGSKGWYELTNNAFNYNGAAWRYQSRTNEV